MLDLMKRTYLLGLGLASLTRERVETLVDELVKKGEIAEKDRPHLIQDLLERAREEQKKMSSSVRDTVQRVIGELGVPTRDKFEELIRRVEELERRAHQHEAGPSDDSTTPDA